MLIIKWWWLSLYALINVFIYLWYMQIIVNLALYSLPGAFLSSIDIFLKIISLPTITQGFKLLTKISPIREPSVSSGFKLFFYYFLLKLSFSLFLTFSCNIIISVQSLLRSTFLVYVWYFFINSEDAKWPSS